MQQPNPTSAFRELTVYGIILAVGACGPLACFGVLYATNFDSRQSLIGLGVLFILLCESIGWILKRCAQTDKERETLRTNGKQLYWGYGWIFVVSTGSWVLLLVFVISLAACMFRKSSG